MLHIVGVKEKSKLNRISIKKFQDFCPYLQKIDNLWVERSKGRYGFSVQKRWYEKFGKQLSDSEITTALEKGEQVKKHATPKGDLLSAFIPPAIAGEPTEYPSLGFRFEKRDILYVCPFETDLVYDASIFDPPSNVRISPDGNGRVKCQIDSQQTIRVSTEPKDDWYYTSACGGGWIHRSQVQIIH